MPDLVKINFVGISEKLIINILSFSVFSEADFSVDNRKL